MPNREFVTLAPAMLTIGWIDNPPLIPGYIREGQRWNGWQCPVFDIEVLRAHRAELAQIFPADPSVDAITPNGIVWDDNDMPHLVEFWEDGTIEDVISTVTIQGREYIDIGSFNFTWETRHTHYYDFSRSAWQCRECDTAIEDCEEH